jgi:glutamine amidotransferase
MHPHHKPTVAVIDYGLGNLFSIQKACEHVGIRAIVTSDIELIKEANGLILPGVGAFGDAMLALNHLGLVEPIQAFARSQKPVLGICLGLQLLFSESDEFGLHPGLDIIAGKVRRLPNDENSKTPLKVPQVGWNRIRVPKSGTAPGENEGCPEVWRDTLLDGIENGAFMYFVHSFYVKPLDEFQTLTQTIYGDTRFCSGVQKGHIYGFQFHPERSGPIGLQIYKNLFTLLNEKLED